MRGNYGETLFASMRERIGGTKFAATAGAPGRACPHLPAWGGWADSPVIYERERWTRAALGLS